MNERNVEIGKNIKKYRKEKKVTQQELATKIGKTESSIRKYEKGLVTIPLDVLEKISSVFDIAPYDLIGNRYWCEKYPDIFQKQEKLNPIVNFLKALDFRVDCVLPDYYEDEKESVEKRVFILNKGEYFASFAPSEINELQDYLKEIIEAGFLKRVLQIRERELQKSPSDE